MSSTGGNLVDSDDDLMTCHVCMNLYNESDRQPKFLDCHHSFCSSCIQGFWGSGEVLSCPSCRIKTNLNGKKLEDLRTNHYALRLIVSANNQAKIAAELKQVKVLAAKSRTWCIECSKIGTESCSQSYHVTCQFEPLFRQTFAATRVKIDKCSAVWDQILTCRRKIIEKYQQVAECLGYFLSKIESRINFNESIINKIMSYQESLDVPSIRDEQVASDEYLADAMNKLNEMASRLDHWEDEADVESPQFELSSLSKVEEQHISIELENEHPHRSGIVQETSVFQKLPLSFQGSNLSHPTNACVSILTYLMMVLLEEGGKLGRNHYYSTGVSKEEYFEEDSIEILEIKSPQKSPEKAELSPSEKISLERTSVNNTPLRSSSPISKTDQKLMMSLSEEEEEDPGDLETSQMSPERFECDICEKSFTRQRTLDKHMEKHPKSSQSPVRKVSAEDSALKSPDSPGEISVKNLSFKSSKSDRKYMGPKAQLNPTPHKCHTCEKEFALKQSLHQHLLSHSTERPFKCRVCSQGFKRSGDLAKHLRKHPKVRSHSTFSRATNFPQVSAFRSTSRPLRPPVASDAANEDLPPAPVAPKYPWNCDVCHKSFQYQSYLKRHVAAVHASPQTLKCKLCDRIFSTKTHLTQHQRAHAVPFQCKVCKKVFKQEENFKKHQTVHAKQNLQCNVCHKKFVWKRDLIRHKQTHRNMEKKFKCTKCTKEFARQDRLKAHVFYCNKTQ